MTTPTRQRTRESGSGRTENLVMKIRPEVKKHLKDVAGAAQISITAYVEHLIVEEMARTEQPPRVPTIS